MYMLNQFLPEVRLCFNSIEIACLNNIQYHILAIKCIGPVIVSPINIFVMFLSGLWCLTPLSTICFFLRNVLLYYFYTLAPPEGGILFYICPSVRPKIFIVTFFSATIDDRNLIFGHKLHIGMPYCGKHFGPIRFLLPICRLSQFLYTLNIYVHFSSHFSQQQLMAEI